jgi:MFS family permease
MSARLAQRYGPRRAVTLGMFLEFVGIVSTSLMIGTTVSGLQLAVPLFVYGVGVGLATAQLTSIVLSDIPPERSGLASGANSTMRQIGSALGIAILGTVLFTALGNGVHENLSAIPGIPPAVVDNVATAMEQSAGQAIVVIRAEPQYAAAVGPIESAFVDATRLAGFVASGFVLIGVVLTLLLPEMPKGGLRETVEAAGPEEAEPVSEEAQPEAVPA